MVPSLYPLTPLACVGVLFVFICRTLIVGRSTSQGSKSFDILSRWVLLFCLVDAVGSVIMRTQVSNTVKYLASLTVHALSLLTSLAWLDFILSYVGDRIDSEQKRRFRKVAIISVVFTAALLIANYWTNMIFRITEEGNYEAMPNRAFYSFFQNFVYIGIAIAVARFAVSDVEVSKNRLIAVLLFIAMPVIFGFLQVAFPPVPLTSLGMTLGCCIIYSFIVTKMDEERALALNTVKQEEEEKRSYMVIADLAADYDLITYVKLKETAQDDMGARYKTSERIKRLIPEIGVTRAFHDVLDLIKDSYVHPDDREQFFKATRRPVIISHLSKNPVYYVNFRTIQEGQTVFSRGKFTADAEDGEIIGFVFGISNVDEENNRILQEQKEREVINVLATDYNAIYYCDAITHDYDILFQKGSVREELEKMLKAFPRFEDAFRNYVDFLVHPDDREMMKNELRLMTGRLKDQKSYTVEFRRRYDGKYLYTEMNCVKIGEAKDELRTFVVGFVENDASYQSMMDLQKQLEYTVTERTAELQKKNITLNKVNEDIVELLGNITEARDVESGEHIRRVKGFTNILAKQVMDDWPEYGITRDSVELMTSASALHDIGKIMVPDSILLKPGKLTPEEFDIMKKHCVNGCEILKKTPPDWSASYLKTSMEICRYHHEKYDGKGYPEGLVGDMIPISAQIVSIADCFDALTTKRVYKDAIGMESAFQMINNGECGAFSEKILASFAHCKESMFKHAVNGASKIASSMPAGISSASLSWTRILFVDDNDLSREMSVDILQEEGAEIVEAASGEEAIEIFRASNRGAFDAILMDVVMPEMNGIEATRIIRALDRPDAKTVPIIALTSLSSEKDIYQCIDAGMDSFLTKPIAISALNKVLYECLQSHSEALDNAVRKANQEAEERIDQNIEKSMMSLGLSGKYDFICYVNGNTNDVSGFRCSPEFKEILDAISKRLPSNRRLDQFFKAIIPVKYFENFRRDTDRTRVLDYLESHTSYHAFVPVALSDKESLFRLRFIPDADHPGGVILGLQSVDAETREELQSRELIRKLTESYLFVNYVDLEDDTFTSYQDFARSFNSMEMGSYSKQMESYILEQIIPEDRERVTSETERNRVREQLKEHKRVSIRYRCISEPNPRYCEMQYVKVDSEESGRFAIFMITDIDDSVRAEERNKKLLRDTQEQLVKAEKKANRDGLTGVKNITAYTDTVSKLSEQIRERNSIPFSVIICDVNKLKDVNDTYGHDVGDIYIRNCCKIICESFKGSPVFRIGGDEFAVLVRDEEYERREELKEQMYQAVRRAEKIPDFKDGKASFAFGIADYDPASGESVADVVKRADAEMYKHKRASLD